MSRRIIFFCNDAAYFTAHRAHVARRLVDEGWEVHVASGGEISALDSSFGTYAMDVERRRFSLCRDLLLTWRIAGLIRKLQPDVVHLITMKPIVFGAIAMAVARFDKKGKPTRTIATFPGLGRAFENCGLLAGVQRSIVSLTLCWLFRQPGTAATFENGVDRDKLVGAGIVSRGQTTVLAGAGLDLASFWRSAKPRKRFAVLWASRLVRGKGLAQFATAARMAYESGDAIDFLAAGQPDPGHPDNFSDSELAKIRDTPGLRFLGHIRLMPELLASVNAVCLPTSYIEGLPRILIEAAAASLPMIASDVPGCREIVKDGANGILLTDLSSASILKAVRRLANNRELAERMGRAARITVLNNGFDQRIVQDMIIELYDRHHEPRSRV